jgi:hypothetical protein
MYKLIPLYRYLLLCICLSACHSAPDPSAGEPAKDSVAKHVEAIHMPELRKDPKKEPVADFTEDMNDRLNKDWTFSVKLFETNKTLAYRVAIRYESMDGDDTVKLPDLGRAPRPIIQKGPDKYSCIIGFLDNDSVFREYKLVYAKGEVFGVKTLKHWAVTQGYRLVDQ